MDLQATVTVVSIVLSLITLALLVVQTRSLSKQTRSVAKSLEYGAYLKLVDYLNEINIQILTNPALQRTFAGLDFVADSLREDDDLSVEKIALAWHLINRYEAAFVGYRHGIVSEREWQVWFSRLKLDLQLPFVRKVWSQDVQNFTYDPAFTDLIEEVLRA